MAYITHPTRTAPSALTGIGARLLRWLEAVGNRHARLDQIERFNRMSDHELADIGLTRDQIVTHVFRDRLGL